MHGLPVRDLRGVLPTFLLSLLLSAGFVSLAAAQTAAIAGQVPRGVVIAAPQDAAGVTIAAIHGDGGRLTTDPRKNTASAAVLALLRKLRQQVDRDPGKLLKWIAVANRHTALDVPAGEQFRLGVLASHLNAKDVGNVTVPVQIGAVGAASVVFISPGAESIYARFKKNGYL